MKQTKPQSAGSRLPAQTSSAPRSDGPASLRFQDAVDDFLNQSASDDEFRQSLLVAALQHAGFVGGAWYSLAESRMSPMTELLEHPALQHESIRLAIKDQAQVAAQQRRELVVPHTIIRNLTQISVPVAQTESSPEVVVLLAADWDAQRQDSGIHAARSIARSFALRTARLELQSTSIQLRTTAAQLELTEQIESATTLAKAHRVLADTVREHLQCRFVAVGRKPVGRVTCQVAAVSGVAEFDSRSNKTRRLKAALDESLIRDMFTSWPAAESSGEHQTMAHRQLAETSQVEAVVSVPLKCADGELVGALVVGGGLNLLANDAVRFLQTLDIPAGTSLRAVRRAQGGPLRRLFGSLRSAKARSAVLATLLVIAATVGVMLIPMPYRVSCSFRVEPVQSHFTVAPYDGVLATTLVEPGDLVQTGQLLATMDAREIRWELAGLTADQSRANKERDVHLADENIADSIMAELEGDRLNSRRDLLNSRLEQLDIHSQVDGVVLSGSLDRKENYPVEVGQKLYEVASLNPLKMEVAVPDVDIDHVREGMPVSFRPDSDPTKVVTGTVERIRPRSQTVNERNVFVAEVTLNNEDGTLRPGMEGLARIESDTHPFGWNLFHKAWEYTMSRVLW